MDRIAGREADVPSDGNPLQGRTPIRGSARPWRVTPRIEGEGFGETQEATG